MTMYYFKYCVWIKWAINLPNAVCTSTISKAVKQDIMAMTPPIINAINSPVLPTAHGMDNKDVPIIVFQIDKLKREKQDFSL